VERGKTHESVWKRANSSGLKDRTPGVVAAVEENKKTIQVTLAGIFKQI